jgi:hypothetical protein
MMNTCWKTHNNSSPTTNVLYLIVGNLPNGTYSAYVYFLQNNIGAAGYAWGLGGVTNYFKEFTAFTSSSNFVTASDTLGTVNPYVNYLKLGGLSTGGSNTLVIPVVWTSGADGLGVCGVQLVPPVTLAVGPQANGQFRLQFPAPGSQSYVVETSTNLASWTPVLTNTPVNGRFTFINTNAIGPQRFYRVRQ